MLRLFTVFRENLKLNEFERLCGYVMVGYGIPALLVAFCIIHVHANSYFRQDVLELTCNAQCKFFHLIELTLK